jgi:hypothetical protein
MTPFAFGQLVFTKLAFDPTYNPSDNSALPMPRRAGLARISGKFETSNKNRRAEFAQQPAVGQKHTYLSDPTAGRMLPGLDRAPWVPRWESKGHSAGFIGVPDESRMGLKKYWPSTTQQWGRSAQPDVRHTGIETPVQAMVNDTFNNRGNTQAPAPTLPGVLQTPRVQRRYANLGAAGHGSGTPAPTGVTGPRPVRGIDNGTLYSNGMFRRPNGVFDPMPTASR